MLAQIRHVAPVRPSAAPEPVTRVYAQLEHDFGMLAPPVILHAPAPELLAACWIMLRESLLAEGTVGRAAKEMAAAAVSLGNRCPYCVDVHGAMLRSMTGGRYTAGELETVPDPDMRRIAAWARSWQPREISWRPHAELVAVATTFHYLNRMVNVFLADSPIPPQVPGSLQRVLMRLFGTVMSSATGRPGAPGASLSLLPGAELPADLSWAREEPILAQAFSRAAAAVETAGSLSVPRTVRELVTAHLAGWDGAPVGLSRSWVTDAVRLLAPVHRPAGRLALLTAMAAYQVDDQVIEEFRQGRPGDRALIELTSWAAFAAARRAAVPALSPIPSKRRTS
ncbi:alkyl hydroperoxide reductase AhpD [Planobispora longispora]|uniref:Alkyl hydroperoxide reductase AhpD n=1 Tax=Planobispora longispora TaxID=28887 RepID=A0A8J3RKU8_9ACTN|nr:alkyl hydroperoxide reductase AhpD [Planobispora longispora]